LVVLSLFFRDPPQNWWPPQVDPIAYRDEVERRKELRAHKNPPATRVWTAGEALRTKNMYLLWINMVTILSVGLFGIALTVPIAQQLGWAGFAAASAGALFALLDGIGRPIAGWMSEYLGRRQTMMLVFITMALSQVGNYFGAAWHNLPLYIIASGIAGLCTGMQFPLFATLTADYYSEATNAQNYGIIYSAKIPGGLVGGIVGSMVVTAVGAESSFLVGAAVAALAAALVLTHHQPTVEEYVRVHARATAPAPGSARGQQAP
jgi:MFS family permease